MLCVNNCGWREYLNSTDFIDISAASCKCKAHLIRLHFTDVSLFTVTDKPFFSSESSMHYIKTTL